jgi:hypothetical protein
MRVGLTPTDIGEVIFLVVIVGASLVGFIVAALKDD